MYLTTCQKALIFKSFSVVIEQPLYIPVLYRQTHSIGYLQQLTRDVLNKIKDAGTWKSERVITSKQGSVIAVEGHQQHNILNFCSNNYLGLAVSTAHTTAYLLKTHNIFGLVQINSKGF
jgi:hypothetical protein